jgi:glycosyltransferase involved in cell wall biosynthesis
VAGKASSRPAGNFAFGGATVAMTRPIRVLELRSVRGKGGGPEKTILYGARQSDPARFAVTVCYLRDLRDRDFEMDSRGRDLGVDYVEVAERHSFDPTIWSKLRALVRRKQIHVVHAHEYKSNLLAWLLARAEPVIPFSTVHGWFGRDTWRERVYYAADKRILPRFPHVVAVSGALRTELIRTGCRPDAVTVIPNGIDHRLFSRLPGQREEIRRRLGVAEDDFVIGAVGRLEYQKRFDLLMEAFAEVRPRHPKLRLLIAGDGGLRHQLLEQHRQLQLGDACVFLGHWTDMPRLYQAFDLFVQASDHEGSPNVVLEAMALKTPIIATDAGGTAEMMTHGMHGLIIESGSRDALARSIECVLNDASGAATRAAAARRRVEEELSFDVRMQRLEAIYEGLMMPQPGPLRRNSATSPTQ